jgi:hypothetical protein
MVVGLILAIITPFISVQSSISNNQVESAASNAVNTYLPVAVNNYPWITSYGAQVINFKKIRMYQIMLVRVD